ncbi:hypothetical protein AB0I61_17500 [Polymorphospora rubra]|uniref:hypothetical protein n=1 Tax=Polymorphospora rubra TaxID=338584 RepID=UPI0033CBDA36
MSAEHRPRNHAPWINRSERRQPQARPARLRDTGWPGAVLLALVLVAVIHSLWG